MKATLAGALLIGTPVAGQDTAAAEALLRTCLGTVEPGAEEECRGAYARQCVTEVPGGDSTVGMSACATTETEAWDRILNGVYADLVVLSKRRATAGGEEIAPAPLEAMLRDAQRAWITFRDTDCEHEYAIWGEGSQRQVAGAVCLLERTATRVFELRGKLKQMRGE